MELVYAYHLLYISILCILPVQCTEALHTDFTLNTDYFYKLHLTVFVMDSEFVLCEEETEFVNIIYLKLRF